MKFSALLFLVLTACSNPTMSPSQAAIKSSQRMIFESRENASENAGTLQEYKVQGRYNPSRCDCPKFEVFAYGRWMRVHFSGEEKELRKSQKYAQLAVSSTDSFPIAGYFLERNSDQASPNGVVYRTFFLTKFN